MRLTSLLFVLLISVALGGCASHGKEIDVSYVETIEDGVTTEKDILAQLGEPLRYFPEEYDSKIMIYVHSYARVPAKTAVCHFLGGKTCSQSIEKGGELLRIVIDKNGVVSSHSYEVKHQS